MVRKAKNRLLCEILNRNDHLKFACYFLIKSRYEKFAPKTSIIKNKIFDMEYCILLDSQPHPINGKSGMASVDQLRLCQEELDNVIPFPIWWDVTLNGVAHTVGEPVTITQGQPLTVTVSVTSKGGKVLVLNVNPNCSGQATLSFI